MNSNLKPGHAGRVRGARAAAHRADDGDAFLPDPNNRHHFEALADIDAEAFAEEFIASATSCEQVAMEAEDEVIDEEWGGPFLELEAEAGTVGEAIPEPPRLDRLPPRFGDRRA